MTRKLTALLMLAFAVAALSIGCGKAKEATSESTPAAESAPATTDTAASMTAPADTAMAH